MGAITALDAIARLASDDETEVIVCVSKPPSPEVAEWVLGALAATRRPAAACMVGGGVEPVAGVHLAATLEEAALAAARLAGHPSEPPGPPRVEWITGGVVRGLFSGARSAARPPRSWPSASATWSPTPRRGGHGAWRASHAATRAWTSARRSSPAAVPTR